MQPLMFILTEFYLIVLKRKAKSSCHKSLTWWGSLHSQGNITLATLWPWYHYRTIGSVRSLSASCEGLGTHCMTQKCFKLWRWAFCRKAPWYFLKRFTSLHSRWCDVTVSTSMCLRRVNTREAAPLSWCPLEAPLSVDWLGRWKMFSGRLWW